MVEVIENITREVVENGTKLQQKVQIRKLKVFSLKPSKHAPFNLEDEKDTKPLENEALHPTWNKKKIKKVLIKADEEIYNLTSLKKRITDQITGYKEFINGKKEYPQEPEPYRPKYQYRQDGCSIKVSNIDEEYGEEDLSKLFEKYGDIRRVFFPVPKYAEKAKIKKRHYGFAIVSFYKGEPVNKIMIDKDEIILGNVILNLTKK